MNQLPVIDISALRSADLVQRQEIAQQIGQTCRDIGFFYVSGHGIKPAIVSKTFAAAQQFFQLPLRSKKQLSIEHSPHNRGYVRLEGERLDERKAHDVKEAFNIGLELDSEHPDVVAGKPFRGLNVWPDLPGWREQLLTYYHAMWQLGVLLHKAFALDLGIAEDFFADKLDAPIATLRLLHYPASRARVLKPGQLGAGEHTDYGNVTLLATDSVAGLEVCQRNGAWLAAPAIPNTFVVNIGDCLMRWTNDIYVSTPHRVQPPETERYSIAFFLDPNPNAVVKTLPACISPNRPARYTTTTGADYLAARLDATYEHRKS